jgi:hypothetical protein
VTHAYALDADGRYTGPCLAPDGCTAWRLLKGERCLWWQGQMWRPVPGLPPKGSRKIDGVPYVPLKDGTPEDEVHRQALCLTRGPWQDGAFYVLVMAGTEPGIPRTLFKHEQQSDLRIFDALPRALPDLREWFKGRLLSGVAWADDDGKRWVVEKERLQHTP